MTLGDEAGERRAIVGTCRFADELTDEPLRRRRAMDGLGPAEALAESPFRVSPLSGVLLGPSLTHEFVTRGRLCAPDSSCGIGAP